MSDDAAPNRMTFLQLLRQPRWISRWAKEAGWGLSLALTVGAIWIANEGLWSKTDWAAPVTHEGDSLQILGWIKAASEGDYHVFDLNFIRRLGAPTEANWNDYPMYEKPFTILLGWCARAAGIYTAGNLGMLLAHMLATFTFYLAARWFRTDRWWCAVGALVYGLQFYIAARGLGHLLLALIYTLPLAVLATWLLSGSRRIERFSPIWALCVAVSFLMGISSPYYLNMFVQLILLAMLMQWLTRRERSNLWAGVHCLVSAGAGFLLIHSGLLMTRFFANANPRALDRSFSEAEIYALRPTEFFMPYPGHRIPAFDSMGGFYQAESAYYQGEMFSPYLGILGVLALAGLVVAGVKTLAKNRATSVPVPFWQVGWVLAYSIVGGVNAWLAYFGVKVFRASNRYSVFVAVMALLWIVPRIARWTKRWGWPLKAGLGIGIVALAWMDQAPPSVRADTHDDVQTRLENDREFVELVEREVSPRAMLFQLPVADFPEGTKVRNMNAYEHLRPFLASDELRMSFGSNRGRMDAAWQHNAQRMPPARMIPLLEQLGFNALVVDRRGFEERGQRFLAIIQGLNYPLLAASENSDRVLIPLRPASPPQDLNTDLFPILDFGAGWRRKDLSATETDWISRGWADVHLNPSLPVGAELELFLVAGGPLPALLRIKLAGELLLEAKLDPATMQNLKARFTRPATDAPLEFRATKPKVSGGRHESEAFVLRDLRINLVQ